MRKFSQYRGVVLTTAIIVLCVIAPSAFSQFVPTPTPSVKSDIDWNRWFYGQRNYGLGAIPEDAVARALAQRDSMRISRNGYSRQDDSETPAAVVAPWSSLGPTIVNSPSRGLISGRITSAAIDSLNPSTLYIASAGGGVWKSTNRGANWAPLTDNLPSLASGAVAVDPFTGEVWYGTGELNFCRDCYYGAGVYRSSDAGTNWTRVAPETFLSSATSSIVFDRKNQGTIFMGRSTALWKSIDKGQTWHAVMTGVVTDFVLNPADSNIAYAALGNAFGASENGIYRSADGGATWTRLTGGLPAQSTIGRVALTIDPSTPTTVYALIGRSSDFTLNGLYRSRDGGNTWTQIASLPREVFLEGPFAVGLFNMMVKVDPRNSSVIYVGGSDLYKSTDAGTSWQNLHIAEGQHDLVFDPSDVQSFYLINNSGIWRSSDAGQSFASLNNTLGITLFQSVAIHPSNPNAFVGATQDNGNVYSTGGFTWDQGRLGDSGTVFYDTFNPQTVYASGHYFDVFRSEDGGKSWSLLTQGVDPSDRVLFYPPLTSQPDQTSLLYFGTHRLWASGDRGDHWFVLSGDLTGGGSATISALAVAPGSAVIYAGTSDGRVQASVDSGRTFVNGSRLPNRFVTSIAIHPIDLTQAVAGVSGFGTGHVFKTFDRGATWADISTNLPDIPVNAVLMDALAPEKIYVGTDIGVFLLGSDGLWTSMNQGLPNVVVLGLTQHPQTGMIVASTHGRGAFALRGTVNTPWVDSFLNLAGLSATSLSPGMTAALTGSNLANGMESPNVPFPLPFTLGGASITINGVAAPLLSASPGQVNFLVPFNISGPIAEISLNNANGQARVRVARVDASPGIFLNGTDANIFHANGSRVTDAAPARSGEELVMYATGLGVVDPAVFPGFPASSSNPSKTILQPLVRVGGVSASVRFSGLTPGQVASYQINFVVPQGLTGKLPVVIDMGSGVLSNTVFMTTGP